MNSLKRFVLFFSVIQLLSIPAEDVSLAEKVRNSVLAGTWYSANSHVLHEQIAGFLSSAAPEDVPKKKIYAMIAPHAGLRYSGATAAWAYKMVQDAPVKRVIILAPSHHVPFRGASIADVSFYETPFGEIPVDTAVCEMLKKHDLIDTVPLAHRAEHAIEIQLPFVQKTVQGALLVPVLIGQLSDSDYYTLAAVLKQAVNDDTLIIVSSDFTHYGKRFSYVPFVSNIKENLRQLDDGAIELILKKDFLGFQNYRRKTGITICGENPIALLLNMLPETVIGKRLSYMTSGQITGDYSNSVSYVSLVFYEPSK